MSGPEWKLSDDLKTVTITFPTSPPVQFVLDAAAVDDLLRNLGELRAHMTPPVPADYQIGQKVAAIPDPRWYTEPEMLSGDSLIHVRDPRFGWLHYLLPRASAQQLAQYLTRQAEDEPCPPTRPN
ncbi:hypothetical protein EMQ25_05790 [Arsenicitalea aurantiaca]|uniref:Uncharacterized protein n=1 Tax=Arsenicitalea aurantiaca TaxID=1783274 RepID=A0A433XEW3_9HYPH|nr:hypothetical protein EMQ25_05790 [Arsenicitalea aurantiaca]